MSVRTAETTHFSGLADWIGDQVNTTIPVHALRTAQCRAWFVGQPDRPNALLLLADYVPGEPWVFGTDADAAVWLLQSLADWTCVNVALDFADALSDALARLTGRKVARYGDLYYEQRTPPPIIVHPHVREMTRNDAALLSTADDDARPGSMDFVDRLLRHGHCTAAIIDGRVVACTHAYCITPSYADIAAATIPAYRGQGLAPACASLLCARLHEAGKTPIWSTGESNLASQAVAAKLEFQLVARRVYLSLA